MQISKVAEDTMSGEGCAGEGGDHAPEYQTASELFDLMTKNTRFDTSDDYSLSAQDLVLLYQNIDIGTRLMSNASDVTLKKPNQYVETIVYNDEHESASDCSDIFTPNDTCDVFKLKQERLGFFNDKSLENLLCPKFGGLDMHTSNLSFDYDKSFLFQDPYVKSQLHNLNLMDTPNELDNLYSTSLTDYICCKRLEDNYNFYMDNIIRYVQNTIEQLKRISNGDYLTDRAKEKWMEVNSYTEQEDTKVLATSTSIPLHVECKQAGDATWDDLVHSEVDIRSLSKILEKKITVEIPKLICGSYRLFSKQCADNLIISCQREQQKVEKEGQEARVDVVLQLQRSQTGQVMSKISSIMILKTTPALPDLHAKEILSLPYKDESDEHIVHSTKEDSKKPATTAIELIRDSEPIVTEPGVGVNDIIVEEIVEDLDDYIDCQNYDSYAGTADYPFSDRIASYTSIQYSSESSLAIRDTYDRPFFPLDRVDEKTYNLISPDELHMTMRKLTMQNSVLNESGEDNMSQSTSKRRSPVRIRIKSPYENKSFLMEEKKRKRLLEIRERREKKKIALSESCKISKHKYGKGATMPQASSSVTKLSITNKSFYNSIYGQNANAETKLKPRKLIGKGDPEVSITIDEAQEEYYESPMLTPDKNNKKYINRSYYLDDTETEMMYIQMKKNENQDIQNPCSASDSNVSNEFNASLDILQELMGPPENNLGDEPIYLTGDSLEGLPKLSYSERKMSLPIAKSTMSLTTAVTAQNTTKKISSTDECRKSIDQLYDLMNKFGNSNDPTDLKATTSSLATNDHDNIQGSESGTSVKHMNVSSHNGNPGRSNMASLKLKSSKTQPARVPKVIINSKLQSPKTEEDPMRKGRNKRTLMSQPFKGPLPDNPLKAISQLLHEFDNVQKNRQRPPNEAKASKKGETIPNDVKTYPRQGSYRRKSRIEYHLKDNDQEKKVPPYNTIPKDKRVKPLTPLELSQAPHKQVPVEDRNPPKKIADIIDEAREARGEAVRGPSKNNSRLNSLAQPKKCYVQAHHEEYQNRYGRNVLAERLQKLATTPAPAIVVERNVSSPTASSKNRWRKSGTETAAASAKQRAQTVPQLDQQKAATSTRKRQSAGSSPETVTRLAPAGLKHIPRTDEPDGLCKKAPESYAHSHYGAAAPCGGGEPLVAGLRCRVPLVPRDIDVVSMTSGPSMDEATELAVTLHRMVGSVVSSATGLLPAHLAALVECAESIAHTDPPRSESDYCVDILEDCHLPTAVGATHAESFSSYVHRPNSATEIEQLETALYNHMSGTFQKRLRIKNLTLTPKPSLQQVFLLQSGDAGSVLVKSVSNLKLKKSSLESLNELKAMPVLSNSRLDWSFAQLPVQIATVGYAFPEHRTQNAGSNALFEVSSLATCENTVQKLCQSSQCWRGISPRPVRDWGAQVDVGKQFMAECVSVSVGSVNNHANNSQMLVTEPVDVGCVVTVDEVESANDSDANKVVGDIGDAEMKIDERSDSSQPAPVLASAPSPTLDTISYTTSLDMLVGLLTEIQKITCQNQMVTSDHQNRTDLDISNDTITVKKVETTACDLISISSLENLRQLESNGSSIYSYHLSNEEGSVNSVEPLLELKRNSKFTEDSVDIQPVASELVIAEDVTVGASKPTGVDREVSANLCKDHADMCTNVPAGAESATAVQPPASSHSALAVVYLTPHCSTTRTLDSNKIIELPQIKTRGRRALICRDKTELNQKRFTALPIRSIESVKNESLIARSELRYCVQNIDLDPMFKIKRDLLVSMYSILVLTVFAALSFPELLIFQS